MNTDVKIFLEELKSWVGTPFGIAPVAEKGRCTDCLNYIVKSAATFFPEFKERIGMGYPVAVRSRTNIVNLHEYLKAIDQQGEVIYELEGKEYHEGDIVLFKYGKFLCHCAVYLGENKFIDTMKGRSVAIKNFCPQVKIKIEKVFRIRRFD